MDLLIQLGVNETLGIQLGMFLVVFVFLKYLLFGPYYAAFNERKERTLGKTELAERFIAEAQELEEKFAVKAQEANDRYREVYDKSRTETMHEYDRVIADARGKAKGLVDESHQKIQKEMAAARTQLQAEVQSVAQLINNKLIGKDLSA
jgi:F0F1-type ATP synthase membrane subunit b/b'